MRSNLPIRHLVFLLALLSPLSAAAETTSDVRVAKPVDRSRSLSAHSLAAVRDSAQVRNNQSKGKVFVRPTITSIRVSQRGARSRVQCSVEMSITRTNGDVLEARATILRTSATVIVPGRSIRSARSDCAVHATNELSRQAARAIARR